MVAVDTNVIIRWLVRDDETLAERADAILKYAEPGSIMLDRLILAEVAYVLKSNYKHTKQEAALNLSAIISHASFSVTDNVLVRAMLDTWEHNGPLSIEDAWLLTLYSSNRVSNVLTFDNALQKRLKT